MSSSWVFIYYILLTCYVCTSHGKTLFESGLLPITQFESKSYYFASLNYKINFFSAVDFCNTLGMRLLTIPRKEVNDFLLTTIKERRKETKFWTSGTRLINGLNWVWIASARSIKYTNWYKNKPLLTDDNQCIGIQLINNKVLEWFDANCRETGLSAICESTANLRNDFDVVPENTQGSVESASINIPLFSNNGSSYYIGNVKTMSFFEANRFCKWIGLELVTIESQEENDFLYSIIRRSVAGSVFWTGGITFINKKHWYWLSSGKNVEYTNWAPGQPDQEREHCFVVRFIYEEGLLWHDYVCDELKYFICETSSNKIYGCPDIDSSINGSNANPNRPNQNGPNQNGPNQNGPNQNGPNQNGSNPNGPNQNGPNQYGPNQNGPNQNGSNQNGSNQNGPNQNGSNQNGSNQNGPNQNGPNQNGPNQNSSNHNKPYLNPPASDYHIGKEKVTHKEAIKKCNELGLKLVSIQNSAKQKTMYEVIAKSGLNTTSFWSSGYLVVNKDLKLWYWSTGEVITKFEWEHESSNITTQEECLSFKGNGVVCYWYQDPCTEEYYYMCEPKK